MSKFFLYSIVVVCLCGCKTLDFRIPPKTCYPDFRMIVAAFDLYPDYDIRLDDIDSVQIVHNSGYIYIKGNNNKHCLGQFFIESCDVANKTIILMDYATAVRVDVGTYRTKPLYVVWKITEKDGHVDCMVTSLRDSSFLQKTSGEIKFLERDKDFRYKPSKYCPKREY